MSDFASQAISSTQARPDTEWLPAQLRTVDTGMSHIGFCCVARSLGTGQESSAASRKEQVQQSAKKKLRASVTEFLEQLRVIRRVLAHPQMPWHAEMIAACALLYVFSPIQLIPNFVAAVRYLKRSVSQAVLDECPE